MFFYAIMEDNLKTAMEQEAGEKINKYLNIWKINKYLKMPSLCAVNYSNCANREKNKSKYRFSSIIRKMARNFRKWEEKSGYLKFSGKI